MINLLNINKEIKNRKIIDNLNLFVEKVNLLLLWVRVDQGKVPY